MADDIEFGCMHADERRDTPVVIRYVPQLKKWYICHEKSYQNAFRNPVNGFDSREDAFQFAQDHDCAVQWHEFDILQSFEI